MYYQWEAQTTATEFWRFKNVQFGLYLGIEKGRVAANDLAIRGVSHPFDWAPERTEEDEAGRSVFKYVFHAILVATSHCVRELTLETIGYSYLFQSKPSSLTTMVAGQSVASKFTLGRTWAVVLRRNGLLIQVCTICPQLPVLKRGSD
jgi:hypothetical protein